MRLKNLRVMTVLFVLSGCALSNSSAQDGDNKFNKKNELEIENYGQKPFRLANVYLQK